MSNFKEWLTEQAGQQSDVVDRQKRIQEWIDAVTDLLDRLKNWLAEDDSKNLLTIRQNLIAKREEGLGSYTIPSMQIALFDRMVEIVPLARNVAGGIGKQRDPDFRAEGRVDMTNGGEKHMLYHVASPTGKKWVIIDERRYAIQEFDKERFEAALQDLLS